MDPFVLVLFGGLGVFVLGAWLLGRFYPGSGLEQLGLRSAREITESREALEAQDLDQMVAARNRRRQARGLIEVHPDQVELQVAGELAEQERRRERYVAEERERHARDQVDRELEERDLDSLLEATNARRRARGLPDRTRAQARQELGGDKHGPGPA